MKKVYELFAAGAGLAARGIVSVFSPSKMKKYVLGTLAVASVATLAVALMAGDLFPGAGDLKVTYKGEVKSPLTTQKIGGVGYYSSKFQCELETNTISKEDIMTDYKNDVRYTIDHKKKVVSKETFDDMAKTLKLNWALLQQMGIAARTEPEKAEVKTEKLGKATIAGRSCDKWKITAARKNVPYVTHVYYLDPSLDNPIQKTRRDKWAKVAKAISSLGDLTAKLKEEADKLKGFSLKTEHELAGITSTQEATKVETVPIPASVFELPKGYRVEDKGKKDLEEAQQHMKELQKMR